MKKIFLDLDGTLARFNVENALARFAVEKYFFKNLLPYENINVINRMARNGNVYILSASPNIQADYDKIEWVNKYLPNISQNHIIICRCGDNKASELRKIGLHIDENCILLDDYTKNLNEWELAGGVGIKRLTKEADNSTKKWKGLCISDLCELDQLV